MLASQGLTRLEDFLRWSAGDRLDKPKLAGWRQRWRMQLARSQGERATFYLKRFARPPLGEQIRRFVTAGLGRATAAVEASNSIRLNGLGILSAAVAAWGQRMSGPLENASFVLLEDVPGRSLERVAEAWAQANHRANAGQLRALAQAAARLHASGHVHRDFYLCHVFLLDGRAGNGPDDYVLIDLQRVFRPRWRMRRWVVKDLAALASSTPEAVAGRFARLRFLTAYVRAWNGAGEARLLAKAIGRRLARRR